MTVRVPVNENLLPILDLFETLVATEPVVAEHVVPIVKNMFDFAMTSGEVTDPKMWVRAMKGAIAYIETNHLDDEWLNRIPIERGEK